MEIRPPIQDRTTDQLTEIVETKDQWRPDVVELAQKELVKRGVSIQSHETKRPTRTIFQRRIEAIKARASYTPIEKILIVLAGPILIAFLDDLTLFTSGEGYKKKNRQGLFYMLLGFGLWFLTFYMYYELKYR